MQSFCVLSSWSQCASSSRHISVFTSQERFTELWYPEALLGFHHIDDYLNYWPCGWTHSSVLLFCWRLRDRGDSLRIKAVLLSRCWPFCPWRYVGETLGHFINITKAFLMLRKFQGFRVSPEPWTKATLKKQKNLPLILYPHITTTLLYSSITARLLES